MFLGGSLYYLLSEYSSLIAWTDGITKFEGFFYQLLRQRSSGQSMKGLTFGD